MLSHRSDDRLSLSVGPRNAEKALGPAVEMNFHDKEHRLARQAALSLSLHCCHSSVRLILTCRRTCETGGTTAWSGAPHPFLNGNLFHRAGGSMRPEEAQEQRPARHLHVPRMTKSPKGATPREQAKCDIKAGRGGEDRGEVGPSSKAERKDTKPDEMTTRRRKLLLPHLYHYPFRQSHLRHPHS